MSVVDVIVPCYNYARYLRACVDSALSQADVDVRILIIDDASTDDTRAVATTLAREDSRVAYTCHPRNRGHIATYNEGLEWASGDYTVLLSADDMLTPGALSRAARLLDTTPGVGFVFGDHVRLMDGLGPSRPGPTARQCTPRIWDGAQWISAVCREGSTFIRSPEVVVRTQLYKALGGYRPELPHTADVEMWLRLAAHADVGQLDADQAVYRIHGNNMHSALAPTALQSLGHWKAAFETFFAHHHHHVRDSAELEKRASATLAIMALGAACSPKHGRDRAARRQLIDFAIRMDPTVGSMRGRIRAGYIGSQRGAYRRTRTLLGAPAYLFRRLLKDGWRCLRFCASGSHPTATYELGRIGGHLDLILRAWLGRTTRSAFVWK